MTYQEILESGKDVLTPYDIAPVLGSDPATIRTTARDYPERVQYPFTFSGSRMKIPRLGFIAWMKGEKGG
jgi:hypothetical protein